MGLLVIASTPTHLFDILGFAHSTIRNTKHTFLLGIFNNTTKKNYNLDRFKNMQFRKIKTTKSLTNQDLVDLCEQEVRYSILAAATVTNYFRRNVLIAVLALLSV
jgi:hypothetical protein